jgi:hypothetical protein
VKDFFLSGVKLLTPPETCSRLIIPHFVLSPNNSPTDPDNVVLIGEFPSPWCEDEKSFSGSTPAPSSGTSGKPGVTLRIRASFLPGRRAKSLRGILNGNHSRHHFVADPGNRVNSQAAHPVRTTDRFRRGGPALAYRATRRNQWNNPVGTGTHGRRWTTSRGFLGRWTRRRRLI